jgi:hypothetical protein
MNDRSTKNRAMMFTRDVTELMKSRVSCRNYQPIAIEKDKRKALELAFSACNPSPFGHCARFHLVERRDQRNKKLKLGTYGMIRNHQYLLVGAIRKSEKAYESYGYLFEQIVLKATELGLGTCWLGYFHKRSAFKHVRLAGDEILPAVSPVGYESPNRALYDRFVQRTITPRRRKPWHVLFFLEDVEHPLSHDVAGPYAVPLEMVRIAPSAGNRQPWRIIKEEQRSRFHFYLDHSHPKKGYDKRSLPRLDMGIAMCHFQLTCEERNIHGQWEENRPGDPSLPAEFEYIVSWHGDDIL